MVTYFVEESNKMKLLVGLNINMDICYFIASNFRELIWPDDS